MRGETTPSKNLLTLASILVMMETVEGGRNINPHIQTVLDAIAEVESRCDDQAIGDRRLGDNCARGRYQIRPPAIADVNRRYGTNYVPQDAHDPAKARQIATLYLSLYTNDYSTPERIARVWNGGPSGHARASTAGYWRKVKAEMERSKINNSMTGGK